MLECEFSVEYIYSRVRRQSNSVLMRNIFWNIYIYSGIFYAKVGRRTPLTESFLKVASYRFHRFHRPCFSVSFMEFQEYFSKDIYHLIIEIGGFLLQLLLTINNVEHVFTKSNTVSWIICRIPGTWHNSSTVNITFEEFCQHRKKNLACYC